jgi:hypothetical protein
LYFYKIKLSPYFQKSRFIFSIDEIRIFIAENVLKTLKIVTIVNKKNTNSKKIKTKTPEKTIRLSQCDIDILKLLRSGLVDVIKIHDTLNNYSDQEISLNLSWLEQKNFVKKVIVTHFAGEKSITYQLDGMGKDYMSKK